jgi:hypothetical protein
MYKSKKYVWQKDRQYRSWVPCVDVEVFRKRVKALADSENWNDKRFETDFFSQLYGRTSLTDEEYETLVKRIAAFFDLPF